jgi:hypothetical protein
MSRDGRLLLAAVLNVVVLSGCYRTTYRSFGVPVSSETKAPEPASHWQHFFVWGLAPDEHVIPANRMCGGDGLVQEVRTQQTFVQGLVEALASFYVNIYSPYDGKVVCASNATAPPAATGGASP